MHSTIPGRELSLEEAAAFSAQQVVDLARSQFLLRQEVEALKQQLDWFRRQLFGQKSERRIIAAADGQMSLVGALAWDQSSAPPAPGRYLYASTGDQEARHR